jgi:4-hydroxy-3-methylbut-2-enyl diphosphate reductase
VIVRDMEDAKRLGAYILDQKTNDEFFREFDSKYSDGFDPSRHLKRVGVVNQTTMLATETQAIADYFKDLMREKYGDADLKLHFADTRDTLCYATNDNQDATYELLKTDADLAIVVGGYNSSNTSHIVELCERNFPTFFINSERELESASLIRHFDFRKKQKVQSQNYLPAKSPLKIVLTSGASCPDTLVDRVMLRLLGFMPLSRKVEEVMAEL